jgi:alpha-N-acetylglucosaminidase
MFWGKALLLGLCASTTFAQSLDGIYDLVRRRMPKHTDSFRFSLVDFNSTNDQFVVSTAANGTILVQGNSISAVAYGYCILQIIHIEQSIDNKAVCTAISLMSRL